MTPVTKIQHAAGVLTWLRFAKIGIRLADGQPRLKFPDDPTIHREKVIEEITKVRDEVIELLSRGFQPDVPSPDDSSENRKTRDIDNTTENA